MKRSVLSLAVGAALVISDATACTTIFVGENASSDGAQYIARNEDMNPANPKVLQVNQEKVNKDTEFKTNLNKFTYTLPEKAMRYTTIPEWNDKGQFRFSSNGFNDASVGISATETIFANEASLKIDPYVEDTGIIEDAIPDVVLPYVSSAKEGVMRLGKIIEEKGAGEGFGVAFIDKDGIWYLETGSGHQWMAAKIPANTYYVTANQGRLEKFDMNDKENYLSSPTLISFAEKNGLYDPKKDGEFNFKKAYTKDDAKSDGYYNYPRVLVLQKMYNPEIKTDFKDVKSNDFPVFLKPAKKLGLEDIKAGLRNHYENVGTSPYATTYPDTTKRPISVFRTQHSHILQVRKDLPKEIGNVRYIAFGMPTLSVYVPVYYGPDSYVEAYTIGSPQADNASAHWKFRKLQTLAMIDFNKYSKIVQAEYSKQEAEFAKEQQAMEKEYLSIYKTDPAKAKQLLQDFQNKVMQDALNTTDKLTNIIMQDLTNSVNERYRFKGA
ncbi:TPA: C69 family dipeptidase [Morganella morganii]|uniref:C69 family dipeptidase n=1 Tax=Morganella morganii TaxID=582 RepID=UPI0033068849|nr:C69 family dipeptidase [Morganella morganii]HBL6943018.1 C69 family dipeptidase [Morganella morganii]